jgi:ribosome-associated toxin RatA of RatAB toxin-antitoxin module
MSTDKATDQQTYQTRHRVHVDAPVEAVYALVADVTSWPHTFPPTIRAEQVEATTDPDSGVTSELIRLWATANGEVKSWTSARELDPAAHRVRFRQVVSRPPVAAMSGEWIVEPTGTGASIVTLLHDYRAVGDDPDDAEWIYRAVDRNSLAELDALAAAAARADGLLLSFTDSVLVAGAAEDLHDFIDRADLWPQRLPHVHSVRLVETEPGVQDLGMDTVAKDGSTHTTRSIRICTPGEGIVYKQLVTPPLMAAHTGAWTFTEVDGGVLASSAHVVVIRPEAVPAVLGAGAGVEQAREFLRGALGANSRATLQHAKAHAEAVAAAADAA